MTRVTHTHTHTHTHTVPAVLRPFITGRATAHSVGINGPSHAQHNTTQYIETPAHRTLSASRGPSTLNSQHSALPHHVRHTPVTTTLPGRAGEEWDMVIMVIFSTDPYVLRCKIRHETARDKEMTHAHVLLKQKWRRTCTNAKFNITKTEPRTTCPGVTYLVKHPGARVWSRLTCAGPRRISSPPTRGFKSAFTLHLWGFITYRKWRAPSSQLRRGLPALTLQSL
ncbi:hypothetical protein E2C01_079150 [Portunus trituberculatus]|uniref:Uncharacterized protein n=1 Tax=Portunus trituberculatus TaxID=210409 RepID=A0A5B7IKQ7_PORTR|nr:hypothetical protein [Portunus trituberculatus]